MYSNQVLRTPIHTRYQDAQINVSYVDVSLPRPIIASCSSNCADIKDVESRVWTEVSKSLQLISEKNMSVLEQMTANMLENVLKGTGYAIVPVTPSSPLIVKMPIGDRSQEDFVKMATIGITCAGALVMVVLTMMKLTGKSKPVPARASTSTAAGKKAKAKKAK